MKSLGVQCATQQGISQTCSSVRVVAYITMLPVWKLGPHLSSVQVGNVLSVKCARLAGNQEKTLKCWYVMPVIKATTPFVFSQRWSRFPLTHGNAEGVVFVLSVGSEE